MLFSPLPSSLPLPASTLSLAKPSTLASAPTTTTTTAASAPSCPTPPLPPTVFLTEDSPMFCGLQQQLDDQVSTLSDIATSLQHILALSHNPEPQPPQPPSSQPVAATLASATLPAANTAGSVLGAPLPGESDMDCIFSWLSQEVVQQVIDNALPPQGLGRLCNPDLLPVDDEHEHAILVNGILIKSIPSAASTSSTCHFTKLIPDICCFTEAWTVYTCIWACAANNTNLSASLGVFLLHIIQTNCTHMWPLVASYILTTCRQRFGHASAALWAQQDQAVWNQHLSTAASFCPPPKSATLGSTNHQADTQLSGPPSKRQKGLKAVPRAMCAGSDTNVVVVPATTVPRTAPDPVQVATPRHPTGLDGLVSLTPLSPTAPDLGPAQRPPLLQGSARHIDGPTGLPDLSTPPLQGLAQLVGNSASMLDLGTPPLQGSAWSVIMPTGLGGTRTPLLQGLAWLFNLVPAALDVPSADWCLSLLLDVWSHDPGLHPNTSFAGNVFDLASQPARHGSMQECAFVWSTLLSLYPDPIYHHQLLGMTEHSCLLGYDRPLHDADCHSNNLPISSAATALPSVNASIPPGFIRIQYEGLQDLLAFVSQNPGFLLWKGNLEDAFQHIVTAKHDMHLLSFSYDSICYHENVLTFRGSSSPWLFNLVTKSLHWLVAACLPTDWPVNHYLDDTFSTVPVSHTAHTLLPVHTLALAVNALGLQLSPKKTFGASTKLEVLGVEIDTVAQTIGITDDQHHHILAQCRSLMQHHSADLLDMQQIAGLLQFVSQVFLCRKAFLRCLYNATRCTLPSKCHLTQPACSELIWWCDVIECWVWHQRPLPSLLTAAHIWTDACPKGYGGYLGLDTSPTAVFAKTVPHRHHKKNIHFLEALTVLEALQCFLPHWSSPTLIMVHVNNENVKHGLCSGCPHNLLTQCLLQETFGLCLKHDLTIQPHGSPTSPALVTLFTQPSMGSVPSNPTMWTLASTPQVSPAAASSAPCAVTSTCTALATQALSSPSPCHSSTRSSSLWKRWLTSSPETTSSFRQPLPLPLPASSAQVSWSGTVAPTMPPSSQSPQLSGHLTMLCSPSPPPRPTLSGRVCMSLPRKWVASSARSLVSGTSPMVAHLQRHSSALALLASTLSPSLPSSPSSATPSTAAPSRLVASWCRSTPATLSIMAWPPGCCSTVPPPLTSSHLAGGALTATTTTLTDWLRSAMLWSHQPSSLSAMAPWFPVALPGEIQAWPDPGLLAPNPIETALSCTGASTTSLAGREPPSSSPHLDPHNPFSVFSSRLCPCPI
ncbi:uncharacterized protein UBRO_20669 [Ustilago bromivora]|uniref:Reverse transcriptase domain-containing protein n=1 Tax=Ustilago bromivora TaxID=307758 RepID=A0A1K0G4U1_9BASI|nr:uncharacterized protein UBRO_20669 [Ustilago bromivora]